METYIQEILLVPCVVFRAQVSGSLSALHIVGVVLVIIVSAAATVVAVRFGC